jgi:hypothetical protein
MINNPTKARSVSVMPVSEDDWEILVSGIQLSSLKRCRQLISGTTCFVSRRESVDAAEIRYERENL